MATLTATAPTMTTPTTTPWKTGNDNVSVGNNATTFLHNETADSTNTAPNSPRDPYHHRGIDTSDNILAGFMIFLLVVAGNE